ncbi:MAG: CpXC domain-containing protein [Candidatus Sabulitectum sp.]|nr:CpXC domain-containing protein [Candidatus Sabulitectum sp.]
MEQLCPRCHEQQVAKSSTSNAGRHAGLIGLLIANSAASYNCPACGKIPLAEFPEEFQSGVKRKRTLSILGAAGVFALIIVLLFVREMM